MAAYFRHPTLLWLNASDLALQWLPVAGAVAAALAAAGIASIPMLAAAWAIYLSLDVALGLTYPWESLLLEAGFLALLLPPIDLLPSLAMTRSPDPLLVTAFYWLLFRVLFGFGKNKFSRDALQDPLYLRAYLIGQPLPSPLGWRAIRLPRVLLVWSHGALFVVEMMLPFLIFFPGWPRDAAAIGITALMISIEMMGNFGFFNLLVAFLCVTLLDPRPIAWHAAMPLWSLRGAITTAAVAWSVAAGLLHLPFNTYVARGWTEWPVWGALTGAARAIVGMLRAAMPFRTVHAYGVFPPRLGPPLKFVPVIEGTRDGTTWEAFEYRCMPSTERSAPCSWRRTVRGSTT